MKRRFPFLVLLLSLLLPACTNKKDPNFIDANDPVVKANFELITSYFKVLRNGTEHFESSARPKRTMELQTQIEWKGHGCQLTLKAESHTLEIKIEPSVVYVLQDKFPRMSLTERKTFVTGMDSIFERPYMCESLGTYEEYNLEYGYRIYFSKLGNDLAMHTDHNFKTNWFTTYIFSKEKGLHTMVFYEGPEDEMNLAQAIVYTKI
jgi:hypothetical protein